MKHFILLTLFVSIIAIHMTVMPLETIYASNIEVEKRIVQQQISEVKIALIEIQQEQRIANKTMGGQEREAIRATLKALELKERVLQNNYIRLIDKSNGKHTKKIKNGVYFGEVNAVGLMEGVGQVTWNNGAKYLGSWKHGKMSGSGKYIYASGGYYEGLFSNDVFSGKGVLVKNNGDRYEGIFEDDEIVEGTYKTTALSYTGGFKSYEFNGYGVLTTATLKKEGVFSKGEMLLGKVTDEQGGVFEQRVKGGKIIKTSNEVQAETSQ